MKKRNKIALISTALLGAIFLASGCTANFCTNDDKSRIAFAVEPGVSEFFNSADYSEISEFGEFDYHEEIPGTGVYQVIRRTEENNYSHSSQLTKVISSAQSSGIVTPELQYFVRLDQIMFEKVISLSSLDLASATTEEIREAVRVNGSVKFCDSKAKDIWSNYKEANVLLRNELGYKVAASIDFEKAYISAMNSSIDAYRSCITTFPDVEYGSYGPNGETVKLDDTTWGYAWTKGGKLIEGLIVYPVAWLVDTFAHLFAGGKSATPAEVSAQYARGVPQLLSLILVTVIVRLFIFLVTIKSTLSQKKMTDLQPELAKIQQKYPNANTNQSEKQRLAEEQMRLYKKHKVNPLSQLLVLIVQFPVFIGVWGAMTGSAVLSTGEVMGLHLSDSIWTTLREGPKNNVGWWTAFVLIILMSVAQFLAMKIPQWIQKAKTKKVARLSKNPAQKSQNRTANIVSYVMLVMIIIMGFTLPAAMGVYWFIGAIVSLAQTLLTTFVFTGKKRAK